MYIFYFPKTCFNIFPSFITGFTPDVKVWDVTFTRSGEFDRVQRAFELKGHTSGVYSFAFNSDSSRMASVSKDGSWKVFDTKSKLIDCFYS